MTDQKKQTVNRDEVRARLQEMRESSDAWKDARSVADVKFELTVIATRAFDTEVDPVELVAGIIWAQEVLGRLRDFENDRSVRIRQILQEDMTL